MTKINKKPINVFLIFAYIFTLCIYVYLFAIAEHNIDLSHNGLIHNFSLDYTQSGKVMELMDLYNYGFNEIRKSLFIIIILCFCLGVLLWENIASH